MIRLLSCEISIKKMYFESFMSKCKCNYLPLKLSPLEISICLVLSLYVKDEESILACKSKD